MKQALLRKGKVTVEEVPVPALDRHNILVEVTRSLISTGTELAAVQSSESSLVQQARNRPAAISKALHSVRVRGVMKTLSYVRSQMEESRPLGYSCAGRVLAMGDAVAGFRVGDRVACAGAGLANHAEIVSVPMNLCVRVPDEVSDRAAAFLTLGAIALQGIRRADVRLGETVCVVGLGLIGQLTVQLLSAAGCRIIGMDLDPGRVQLATEHGMTRGTTSSEELASIVQMTTGQAGADVTILTASTSSSELTQLAFQLTRKKGKIVVVGTVGLELKRSPFYEKEQDFLISCSYGPGRYDSAYEKEGRDYPFAYVRWTENRNMAAFLALLQQQRIDVESLIDKEVPLEEANTAYEALGKRNGSRPLAVVIRYSGSAGHSRKPQPLIKREFSSTRNGVVKLGLIGAGSFAKSILIPNVERMKEKFQIMGVCTGKGATAVTMGRELNARLVSNDYREILNTSEIDAVLVSTRHDNHAEIAEAALRAGKHIYLEKPLALTLDQLDSMDSLVQELSPCPVFMVGYNRRFSPFAKKLAGLLLNRTTPLLVNYRVNAGMLPQSHWAQTHEGGGRLRGEACHMIDLFRFLVKQPLTGYDIEVLSAGAELRPDENFVARFIYADGSLCTLVYTAIGSKHLPKEQAEFHWDGKSAALDDFKRLCVYGCSENMNLSAPDKGHVNALETFASAIANGTSFPIPWEQLFETTRATIELDREAWGHRPTYLANDEFPVTNDEGSPNEKISKPG